MFLIHFLLLTFSTFISPGLSLVPRLQIQQLIVLQGIGPTEPSQCLSICSNINTILQNCADTDCFCTSANANAMEKCVNCSYNAPGADDTVKSSAVNTMNTMELTCAAYSLPSMTIISTISSSDTLATSSMNSSSNSITNSTSSNSTSNSTIPTSFSISTTQQITITKIPSAVTTITPPALSSSGSALAMQTSGQSVPNAAVSSFGIEMKVASLALVFGSVVMLTLM